LFGTDVVPVRERRSEVKKRDLFLHLAVPTLLLKIIVFLNSILEVERVFWFVAVQKCTSFPLITKVLLIFL
jgi:hypothetical protein